MVLSRLYDASGQPVVIGGQLGQGGEGTIFEVPAEPDRVAKIYHQAISEEKAEKLRWMARSATADLCNFTAWPSATLHPRPGGAVVGFVMNRALGHEAHVLYSPAQRQKEKDFARADWAFLVHTAMNCAAAFEALHGAGHVIGDVNQRNVLVSERATVRLIDCDSFQVRANGRLFTCGVGVGEYTPPELQGQSSRGVERTPNHDRFGLAVLIFHLLFMGRHPFAGRSLDRRDLPLEQAIQEFRFAYSRAAAQYQIEAPPHSLPLTVVSADLARLFERAFSRHSAQPGARPTAAEWSQQLLQFKKELKRCANDPGHRVPCHWSHCPWCALMQKGGPNYFAAIAILRARAAAIFHLALVWQQIQQVPAPPAGYQRPSLPVQTRIVPSPLPGHLPSRPAPCIPMALPPKARVPRTFLQKSVGWMVSGAVIVSLIGVYAAPKPLIALALVTAAMLGSWWAVLETIRLLREKWQNAGWSKAYRAGRQVIKRHKQDVARWQYTVRNEHARRKQVLQSAHNALLRAEQHWQQEAARHQQKFLEIKAHLESLKYRYEMLQEDYRQEEHQLQSNIKAAQFDQFLRGKFISNYRIADIGPVRKAALRSYGIETAFDVEEASIDQVPGFGPKLTIKLLQWKKEMEDEFRFDPKAGIPPPVVAALDAKYGQLRLELETQLTKGAQSLKIHAANAENHLSQMLIGIENLVVQGMQAEADFRVVAP
jgi:DNA-binding helix-hairpin-helix protein with protein kinase domain